MANVRYHKVGKWPACLLFSCFTPSLKKKQYTFTGHRIKEEGGMKKEQ